MYVLIRFCTNMPIVYALLVIMNVLDCSLLRLRCLAAHSVWSLFANSYSSQFVSNHLNLYLFFDQFVLILHVLCYMPVATKQTYGSLLSIMIWVCLFVLIFRACKQLHFISCNNLRCLFSFKLILFCSFYESLKIMRVNL